MIRFTVSNLAHRRDNAGEEMVSMPLLNRWSLRPGRALASRHSASGAPPSLEIHPLARRRTLEHLPAGLVSQLQAKHTQRPCLITVPAAVPPHSVRHRCECCPAGLGLLDVTGAAPLSATLGCCAAWECSRVCRFFKWPFLKKSLFCLVQRSHGLSCSLSASATHLGYCYF